MIERKENSPVSREVEDEVLEMDGWMDGQIKHRQQPLNRGLITPARRDAMENRFGSEGLKSIQTKGGSRRMEVEDSGCQHCCWDGVRSHFSSVITLSVSCSLLSVQLLSQWGGAVPAELHMAIWLESHSLASGAMQLLIDTAHEKLNGDGLNVRHSFSQQDFLWMLAGHWPDSLLT